MTNQASEWFTLIKKYSLLRNFSTDYRLADTIGIGNFAKVNLVYSKKDNTQFACKCYEKEFMRDKINKVEFAHLHLLDLHYK
jgi:calcium/calmodulin-dependent protein kinase I